MRGGEIEKESSELGPLEVQRRVRERREIVEGKEDLLSMRIVEHHVISALNPIIGGTVLANAQPVDSMRREWMATLHPVIHAEPCWQKSMCPINREFRTRVNCSAGSAADCWTIARLQTSPLSMFNISVPK